MLQNINLLKSKMSVISFFFITLLLGLLFPKSAFAATYTLSGHVADSSGTAISDAAVSVTDATTNANVGTTTTDNSGNYSIIIVNGIYNIKATPPAGSSFASTVALSQNVSSDKILDFILTPSGAVTLSGHVYDTLGNPIEGQIVAFQNAGSLVTRVTTDSTGSYSLQAVSGNYTLAINANNNPSSLNMSQYYEIYKENYLHNQNTVFDITIPVKKVTLQVKDASGNPVSDVKIKVATSDGGHANVGGLSIGGNITNASGGSSYGVFGPAPVTDSAGFVSLWLLPTNQNHVYKFTATPPAGSSFAQTTQNSISLTDDTNLTITLLQPVTLSGHLYDAVGNPVVGQNVSLQNAGSLVATATTDSSGNYSLQVLSGNYTLVVNGNNNPSSINVPQSYDLFTTYSLTQNSVLDITMPVKQISIHVQDIEGNPVSGAGIKAATTDFAPANVGGLSIGGNINNASGSNTYGFNGAIAPLTNSEGNAILWLFPTGQFHLYKFTVLPPSGGNFAQTTLDNLSIVGDTQKIIIMSQPVVLSGHVYDSLGNPLANQTVDFQKAGSLVARATTDAAGNYSLQALQDNYTLAVYATNNSLSNNISQTYEIYKENYSHNQNTTLDITIPVKKVTLRVQNANGDPVSDIGLKAETSDGGHANVGGLSIGGSITNASGGSKYGIFGSLPSTNSSGEVDLWLLPTNQNHVYKFTAIPPSGIIYAQFTLNNIAITGDQTQIVSLQYSHNPPTTTATLDTQHTDGTYSNPTTVTLSASAAAGYTVANTYYKVDGGAQQIYTAPFTVSDEAEHTVEYWSVDNTGVQEAHHTQTFTIYVNKAPQVSPFSGETINAGDSFTASSSFSDTDSSSWTATVDYGEGAGPQSLSLNPNKTFSLNHQYNTTGTYTVTVVVRDNQQSTGTTMATVIVNNPPPTTLTPEADTYIKQGLGNENEGGATFLRLQESGHNRAVVRFNESQIQAAVGNAQNYTAKLKLTITDNGNNWGTSGRTIDIHRLTANWAEGNGTENNRGTGSGATWNCAVDTDIHNQNDDCSGLTAWEMTTSSLWPFVSTPTATKTITNNQSGIVEIDVTVDVQSFINGSTQNYGWVLKKTNESQSGKVEFGSKESGSTPQLVITRI